MLAVRRVGAGLISLGTGVLDSLWPQTCRACGVQVRGGGPPVCDACAAVIQAELEQPWCTRCGRTLAAVAIHEERCARCKTEAYWHLAGVARVARYPAPLRAMLLNLKYRGQEWMADYVAELLATALQRRGWVEAIDAYVPVPMHWLRRCQRPCDHARVLAQALGRRLGKPVVRLVRRAKHGPSQTGQRSKQARFENVRGCFGPPAWWQRWGQPRLAGRTICVVDNLMVSGATVLEVAKVLRRAGARRIYAVVVARPPSPGDPPSQAVEPV